MHFQVPYKRYFKLYIYIYIYIYILKIAFSTPNKVRGVKRMGVIDPREKN